ncbi:MAG: S41 family peptidase [Planctomycetota bacterium]
MMPIRLFCLFLAFFFGGPVSTSAVAADADAPSSDAGLFRSPDVSKTDIVFSYAGGLWIVGRDGGLASPLADPPGTESTPKFSPDGRQVAFVGNYDSGRDLYVIPARGGIAQRRTFHPASERLCDWTPEGGLLFSSNGHAGLSRMEQLFVIDADAALPTRLPVPYGNNGALSGDGKTLAYTPYSRDRRTWKRYRGGMASDIWTLQLDAPEIADPGAVDGETETGAPNDSISKRVTNWEGTDSLPMWFGKQIYYLSDAGPNHRLNIWVWNPEDDSHRQVTRFVDYDTKDASIGPGPEDQGEIILQNGPKLYLLDLGNEKLAEVSIRIPGDRPRLRPAKIDASKFMGGGSVSPQGKRVAVSARGDIWTLPAKSGIPRNLDDSDGSAERYPAWSPDGRWIAYFSDKTGEYELYVTQSDGRGETKQLTDDGTHWRYTPVWSPDSSKLLFTDKSGQIICVDVPSKQTKVLDQDGWASNPTLSFSHDSRWLAYDRRADDEIGKSSIWVYDFENETTTQLTSGYFNDTEPAFDRKGDFLYFVSSRSFKNPEYESVGQSFIYSNTEVLLAAPLRSNVKNPLLPETDEVQWEDDADADDDEADETPEKKESDKKESEDGDSDSPGDPIAGVWTMKVESELIPAEARTVTLIIKRDGDSISGSVSTPGGDLPITDASFDPATGKFSCQVKSPLGPAVVSARVKGDSFSGQVKIATAGITAPVTGKRQAADDDSPKKVSDDGDGENKDDDDSKADTESFDIDFEGLQRRVIPVPVPAGRFGQLQVSAGGKLLYTRIGDEGPQLKLFEMAADEPSEQTVAAGVGGFEVSADGKHVLVAVGGSFAVIRASAGQNLSKKVITQPMHKRVDRRAEWLQMFDDAWRMQRDFFYDPTMHGVDWDAVKVRYRDLVGKAGSREDVGFIIGEMISELNVGHAYYRRGSEEGGGANSNVGMLGARLEVDGDHYRIAELYRGGPWDTDAQNPLEIAGAKVGHHLIAIDGMELKTDENPYERLQSLGGKTVRLTLLDEAAQAGKENDQVGKDDPEASKEDPDDGKRIITVRLPGNDTNLRFRHWIETNRQKVDRWSDGQVGYIYVVNTGIPGQNDLFRQFYAQMHKPALLIDERWNGGGQIPTRFIELLNRPSTNYWARRDGQDWRWPPDSHQGPKAMLINGLAGSGGDMFPALFRAAGLGKLIGRRTWGGLVGITGGPQLIDGASVSVPTFAYYENDGTWGIEGYGVAPDIDVIDDPAKMINGGDPQLRAGVDHLLEEIKRRPYRKPPRPAYPDRRAMEIPESDR